MPTYAYRCRKCGNEFEEFHGIRDNKPRKCPKCKGRADRVPAGGSGLLFKGSGFYTTDYRSKDYKDRARADKSSGDSGAKPSGESKKPADSGGKKSADRGGKSGGG
jgi:putative FmdB family regulatory protein